MFKIDPKMERNIALLALLTGALSLMTWTKSFVLNTLSMQLFAGIDVATVVGVIGVVELWRIYKRKLG